MNLSKAVSSDLELLATGALSPLTGFMCEADYRGTLSDMRLSGGAVWTMPVTLAIPDEVAEDIRPGKEIGLCEGDRILAVMNVEEMYRYNKMEEALEVFHTTDESHPGVARLYRQGDTLLGGEVWLLDWPNSALEDFPELRHTPVQTRRMFARRGWRRVVGFQTRNPIHRAHEYIQKTALEIVDGLFLHPLVGETNEADIPAEVRIESYHAILRDYYPAERVLLGVFPGTMRYAGPREAVFHALCRKNYGCTHFIVGRDHAGFGDYYGAFDAQELFDAFEPDEIGMTPLYFDFTFYCKKCKTVLSAKTCPHDHEDWVNLSGSEIRAMLDRGESLPEEHTRAEVSTVLLDGMRRWKDKHGAENPEG